MKRKKAKGKLCGFRNLHTRNLAIVEYILSTDATTRQTAKYFGLSKTTIENACHYVMDIGRSNKSYRNIARRIRMVFDDHIQKSLFPHPVKEFVKKFRQRLGRM